MSGGTRSAALDRLERTGLGLGVVFLLALAAGLLADRAQFFRSYLYGYLFWVMVGVGSLGLGMLSHLTGGLWIGHCHFSRHRILPTSPHGPLQSGIDNSRQSRNRGNNRRTATISHVD